MRRIIVLALVAWGCGPSPSPAARFALEKLVPVRNITLQQIEIRRMAEPDKKQYQQLQQAKDDLLKAILARGARGLQDAPDDAGLMLALFEAWIIRSEDTELFGQDREEEKALQEALDLAERASKIRPPAPADLVRWGSALRRLNRYSEARAKLAEALRGDSADVRALAEDGLAAHGLDDYDAAVERLRAARPGAATLPPELGRHAEALAATAEERKPLWKLEQEIRARKAVPPLPEVKLVTSRGEIVIELFEDDAPNTVANFITLAQKGYYNGTRFHRVIHEFMAQGGDPNSRNSDPRDDGTGGPGYSIRDELEPGKFRRHFRGSLSMANSGPDTGGSQFFITHGPTGHLDGKHTVFGRVVAGMEVVERISIGDVLKEVVVVRKRDHPYRPLTEK